MSSAWTTTSAVPWPSHSGGASARTKVTGWVRVRAGARPKAAIAEGVIVLSCGTYGNVIRFLPPLTIGDDLLHEGLDVVAAALAAN